MLICLMQGPGKKWEHYDLNKNGKPVRIPMHVKKGDTVQVIAGRDKGTIGEVTKVHSLCLVVDAMEMILLMTCYRANERVSIIVQSHDGQEHGCGRLQKSFRGSG